MFKLILQLHAHKKGTGSSHNGRDSNARDYTIYAKIAGTVRFGRRGRTERIISVEPLEEAKEA